MQARRRAVVIVPLCLFLIFLGIRNVSLVKSTAPKARPRAVMPTLDKVCPEKIDTTEVSLRIPVYAPDAPRLQPSHPQPVSCNRETRRFDYISMTYIAARPPPAKMQQENKAA